MPLEAQIVGTRGRLEGDPQLRGHFGRIPFDFEPPGVALLADVALDDAILDEGMTTAQLSEALTWAATLDDDATEALLSDTIAETAEVSDEVVWTAELEEKPLDGND